MPDIYAKAILTWGAEAQLGEAQAKCAGLIIEIVRYRNSPENHSELLNRVADVEIALEQIKTMFDFDDYSRIRDKKLLRMEKKLAEATRDKSHIALTLLSEKVG